MAHDDDVAGEDWLFTEKALAASREAAREQAEKVLQRGPSTAPGPETERRGPGTGAAEPRPLGPEEGSRLALFYVQKAVDLCGLCGAPPEVAWTAVVYHRRFFAARSPMEFDPMLLMFACVHLACKIEEVREITLDKILEAAGLSDKVSSYNPKVAALELPLLEGIRFSLLVEPKPGPTLRMLAEELRQQGQGREALTLSEASWSEAVARAERLTIDLGVRTDAVLLWPASAVIAGALSVALDECIVGSGATESSAPSEGTKMLRALLDSSLQGEPQRAVARSMLEAVRSDIARLNALGSIAEEDMKATAKAARKCHRAFERLREERAQQTEESRLERKRRRSEAVGMERRHVPTPTLQALAAGGLASSAASRRGTVALADDDTFVIHRVQEAMEEDG
mmetsp:Transcript_43167/g.94103  ORF Transcript_43167/g.94103 Transcript_43167/m.94103 type:complete len:398 (-) Transcript_43167:35-1228(-)